MTDKTPTESDIESAVDLDTISYADGYRAKAQTCIVWAQANPDICYATRASVAKDCYLYT